MAAFALVFAAGCSHDPDDGGSGGDTTVSGDEGEAGGSEGDGNSGDEGASGGDEGEGDGSLGNEGASDGNEGETGGSEGDGNSGDEGASGGNEGEAGGSEGDNEGAEGDSSDGDDAETEPVAITADDVQSVINAISSIKGTTQSSTTWNFRLVTLALENGAYTVSVTWNGALADPSISATFSNLTSQDVSTELLTAKLSSITEWDTTPTIGTQESGRITVGIELASGASGYYIPDELQAVTIIFTPNTDLNKTWAE